MSEKSKVLQQLGEEHVNALKNFCKELLDKCDVDSIIVAAFLLGVLFEKGKYDSKVILEGFRLIEGRQIGRVRATEVLLQQGKRTHRAIVDAASKLYDEDESLRRNDLKTARLIEAMKLDALRKRRGNYLGREAIVKHLRKAREKN